MVRCSGIGVEHVRLNFCTDVEEFSPSAIPRLRDAKTRTRSVSGSGDGGIGVEDAHLQFHHDLEGFCPSAVPRFSARKDDDAFDQWISSFFGRGSFVFPCTT